MQRKGAKIFQFCVDKRVGVSARTLKLSDKCFNNDFYFERGKHSKKCTIITHNIVTMMIDGVFVFSQFLFCSFAGVYLRNLNTTSNALVINFLLGIAFAYCYFVCYCLQYSNL